MMATQRAGLVELMQATEASLGKRSDALNVAITAQHGCAAGVWGTAAVSAGARGVFGEGGATR